MQRIFPVLVSCTLVVVLLSVTASADPRITREGQMLLEKMERTMDEGARSPLQGAWIGSQGRSALVLIFRQNVCAMGMDHQELYGIFQTQGRRLHMELQTGKKVDFTYSFQGDTLVLDNEIRLTRYPLRGENGMNSGLNQAFGNRSDTIPGFGATGYAAEGYGSGSYLDGRWVSQTAQGRAEFLFSGSTYTFFMNGRETEAGTFSLQNGLLSYRVARGTGVGNTGTHRISLQGNQLQIFMPNGTTMVFVRQSAF